MTKVWQQLFYFCKPYKKDLIIVLTSLFSVAVSLLFIGNFIKRFIDRGLKVDDISHLNQTALLLAVLIVFFAISSFFRSYYINNLTEKITNDIKLMTYQKTLKLTITQFEELKIGDIVTRLDGDLEQVAKLITNFLSFFIRNSIMLIGALILMFIQSTKLSFLTIIVVPLLLAPIFKLSKFVRNLTKENTQIKSNLTSDLIETFNNIRIIHAFNREDDKIVKFKTIIDKYLKFAAKRFQIRSLFFALSISIILLSIIFVIWLGSIDIIKGVMTSGQMISFIYYAIIAAMSGTSIIELFTELSGPLNSAERIFELVNLSIDSNLSDNNKNIDQNFTDSLIIEFKNIDFYYPSRKNNKALSNLSLKIQGNKFIGIIGKSGSGKSTIFQLLLKFYEPTKGIITINQNDFTKFSFQSIRSLISYVPQEASILSGTIKSNITFSKPNATDDEINKVILITGLEVLVNDLENKLNTEIGERGVKLSGGQKQRIAIARALLNNTNILLLDEATSALDIEGEKNLLKALRTSYQDKTIISISHRIASLEDSDEIYIIDKGTVIEKGTHAELLKTSLYYQYTFNEQNF